MHTALFCHDVVDASLNVDFLYDIFAGKGAADCGNRHDLFADNGLLVVKADHYGRFYLAAQLNGDLNCLFYGLFLVPYRP